MTAAVGASRTRVLKVVPTLLCGGTESQVMTLSRGLDVDRFDLHVACLRRLGPFVAELDERRIPLSEYRISTFGSVRALGQQARFANYIVRHRIQIVHAYNFYGNVFAIPPATMAAAPVVIASIRDRGAYLTAMQKRVQRYICRMASCVLVNAEAVKDWLVEQGYDTSRIVVIPNGVDLSRFGPAVDPLAVRAELGLPREAPVVTVVSRLSRFKGIEHFLEAAALLAPQYPALRFLIVGETSLGDTRYLPELMGRVDRLGVGERVTFTGLRADVPAILAGASVAVMPSLNEALSNVVLESMAAGAAIVATRVGGTPEAIADGVNGLLVAPGDPRALAAAVARFLENPRLAEALGRAARRTIEERYSVERMIHATEQLYADLLARRARVRSLAPWPLRSSSRPLRRASSLESR